VQERLRLAAVQAEVEESERIFVCLYWVWQKFVLKLKQPDVEPELWAQTSSLTYLIEVSEVYLDTLSETYLSQSCLVLT